VQGFSDHHQYRFSDLVDLASKGESLIMTEKDAVKCRPFAKENWWYLPVSAHINEKQAANIINKIKQIKAHYGSQTA